jgi:23S rRNA pseudouridine1911/1915/1917 synthase
MNERIPPALAGERLDRVLAMVAGITRSKAATLVAAGAVTVNDAVVTTGTHRLSEDDLIDVELPPDEGPEPLQPAPEIDLTIVYEDDDLLIVDKQPGLVVHPGAGNWTGTLAQAVLARYPEIAEVGDRERPGIVHRLDRDTSGLMVVARSDLAYERLVALLGARDVDRRYRTLVWGRLDNNSGMIEAPIGRSSRDPTKMAVSARGREARTRYEVDAVFSDPANVALLTCKLDTGRTHQIRVHTAAIGHPVVGDERYGGVKPAIEMPRMFLHAAQLAFDHPRTGERLSFEAPLPDDLATVLATLS